MVNGEEFTGLGVSGTGKVLERKEGESERGLAKRQMKEFLKEPKERTPKELKQAFVAGGKKVRDRITELSKSKRINKIKNALIKQKDNVLKKTLRLPKFLRDTPSEARALRTLRNLTRPQKRAPLDVPPQRFRQPPTVLQMIPKSFEPVKMDFKSNPLSTLFGSREVKTAQEERESIIRRKDIFFR